MTHDVRKQIVHVLDRAKQLHGKGETTPELGAELAAALRMSHAAEELPITARVHYALATHEMICLRLNAAIQHCEAGLVLVGGTHTQIEVDLLVLLSRQYIANDVIKAREITTNAMALSKNVNGSVSPSVMLRHAEAIGANGDVDGSIALLRQAEALFELDGDVPGRILVLLRLCVQLVNNKQFSLVIEYATEVIGLADALDRRMAKVNAFKFLAMALNGIGKPAEAYEVGKRALDLAEAHYPGHLVGDCSGVLGDVYLKLNDLPTALNCFARALSVYRESGHRNGQALCLIRLAEVYGSAGQVELSERLLTEAEELCDTIGNAVLKRSATFVRAGLYMRQHNASDRASIDAVDRAVDVFRRIAGSSSTQPLPILDDIDFNIAPLPPRELTPIPTTSNEQNVHIKVTTLGSFRVERGGAEITMEEWRRKKARDVFKYLVTRHRRSVSVDEIVMYVWGEDVDVERCLPTLQNAVSAIRTALEPELKPRQNSRYILFRDGSYLLDLGPDAIVDLHDYTAMATAALSVVDPQQRLEALRVAADSYTGDFLPGDTYDDWTDFTRITTRELAIEVLNQLAAVQFSMDMGSAARITMQRLAALDP
jgi:DNA-binding SARP family transcriptional activator